MRFRATRARLSADLSYSAVVGLPLCETRQLLLSADIPVRYGWALLNFWGDLFGLYGGDVGVPAIYVSSGGR